MFFSPEAGPALRTSVSLTGQADVDPKKTNKQKQVPVPPPPASAAADLNRMLMSFHTGVTRLSDVCQADA